MAVVDVTTSITIERALEDVARYAGDPSNAPEWYVNISSVEWETPPPLAVGSRLRFVASFLGRKLRYSYVISELVPNARLVMTTAEGPFPMQTTYVWQAAGPVTTTMTLRNRGDPSGFSRLAAPLLAPAMRRANRKDLRRLKLILERRPQPGVG